MGAVDLTKEFQPQTINAGGVSTLTFNLNNRTVNAVATINFTDTLPADVRVEMCIRDSNFTDFSDDLTNFDYDHRGWFLNLVGTY